MAPMADTYLPALYRVADGGPGGLRLGGDPGAIPLRLVSAGVETTSDEWQGAELHTSFWRVYQTDGPGVSLTWAGGRMTYPSEGMICVPGWIRYRFHWRQRVVHRYIHFEPTSWPRTLVADCFPSPFLIPDRALGAELRVLTARFAEAGAWPPGLSLEVQGLACRILAAALARLDPARRGRLFPDRHGRFAGALALVEDGLHRPLAVPELAAATGMRPQPFIRAFRRAYGTTPMQFVIERRVARACRLLLDGAADLDAVARACGFANRRYLTRMFGRAMGVGPVTYRRRPAGEVAPPAS